MKSGEGTVPVADKPGTYVYVCLVDKPDLHYELGMWGTFIVEG